MHKRTAHRWRLLITMTAGIFFAAGSFWLLQVMQRDDGDLTVGPARDEPDYIVERFSFVRMSPNGQPHYLFYGDKLTHMPEGDASDVEKPVLKTIVPGQPTMTVTSQRARIFHSEDKVDLIGDVDVHRPQSPSARYLRLKTEALTVFPDEDRMESDQKVAMVLGASTVTGVGMQANNATRQIDFRSKGHIVYPPKAAR
ncbi:MAG TPA: LPS export ABC transporter periplasmic protein LptC [Telluria sp.]|jgi:lipopolysaccharide export system protein LptC|nr:LPS export ABC transporter periplasmic protein LptC [Telluria sp.]